MGERERLFQDRASGNATYLINVRSDRGVGFTDALRMRDEHLRALERLQPPRPNSGPAAEEPVVEVESEDEERARKPRGRKRAVIESESEGEDSDASSGLEIVEDDEMEAEENSRKKGKAPPPGKAAPAKKEAAAAAAKKAPAATPPTAKPAAAPPPPFGARPRPGAAAFQPPASRPLTGFWRCREPVAGDFYVLLVRELPDLARGSMRFVNTVRPATGIAPKPWAAAQLMDKYVRTSDQDAQERWDRQYFKGGTCPADSPELDARGFRVYKKDGSLMGFSSVRIKNYFLVSGTVLPVWRSVLDATLSRGDNSRRAMFEVFRAVTTDQAEQKLVGINFQERMLGQLREMFSAFDRQDAERQQLRIREGLVVEPEDDVPEESESEPEDDAPIVVIESDADEESPIPIDLDDDLAACGLGGGAGRLRKRTGMGAAEVPSRGRGPSGGIPLSDDEDEDEETGLVGYGRGRAAGPSRVERRRILASDDEDEA